MFCAAMMVKLSIAYVEKSTVEIEGGAIEKWAKNIAQEHGFRDVGHTAEIFGLCAKC